MKKPTSNRVKVFSFFLAVLMLVGAFPASASAYGFEDFNGNITSGWEHFDEFTGQESVDQWGEEKDSSTSTETDDFSDEKMNEQEKSSSNNPTEENFAKAKEPLPLGASGDRGKMLPWAENFHEMVQASPFIRGTNVSGVNTVPLYWSGGNIEFGGGSVGWVGSGYLYKITHSSGEAFCAEFNGRAAGGTYVLSGDGSSAGIKQILANYDKSGKNQTDYITAQIQIWSILLGAPVTSWGGFSPNMNIVNGTSPTTDMKYFIHENKDDLHTQNILTFENKQTPDPDPDPKPDPEEYKIRIFKQNSADNSLLSGATFSISHTSHGNIGTFTMTSGTFELTVPWAGTYIITEESPPPNFVAPDDPDQTVYVDKNSPVGEVTFLNDPYTGIEVSKIDSATGERLAGATIKIEEISTGMTYTKVTNGSGIAMFSGLRPNDYAVTEILSPTGYKLNPTVFPVSLESGKLASVTIPDDKLGGLIVKKVDPSGGPIAGAVFEIRTGGGTVITRETTDVNGIIFRGNLPTDTYEVEEIQAAPSYLMDENNPQSIYIDNTNPNKEFQLTFVNQKRPSIEILKVDEENPSKVLFGATFRIVDTSTGHSWDITTNLNGIARLENLTPGITYLCTETVSPEGYVLDSTSLPIVLEPNKTHTITVSNKQISEMTILKKDATTGLPLSDTTFRITYNNGSSFQDITTNSAGIAKINLPEGWITILEIQSKEGWILNDAPIQKYIRDGEDLQVEIYNHTVPKLKLIKECSKTGARLPGAYFKIWQTTGTGDVYLGEFISDNDGEINVTLPVGSFTIEETRAPNGFEIDTEIKEFTTEQDKTTTITFLNTPKNPIFIQKVDSDGIPLAGAVFRVTSVSGEFVAEVTSNRQGYAMVPADAGKFYVVEEVRAPAGHILSSKPITIEVKLGEISTVEFVNEKMPGFTLLKLSEEDNKPIPFTRYKITTTSGELIGEFETDHTGTVHLEQIPQNTQAIVVVEIKANDDYVIDRTPHTLQLTPDGHESITLYNKRKPGLTILKLSAEDNKPMKDIVFTVESIAGEPLGEFTTDHSGRIHITNIKDGTTAVVVTEIRTDDNHILDSTPHTVLLNDTENSITLYNDKKPQFLLTKRDAETKEPVMGARFKITSLTGELIGEFESDRSGRVFIDNVPDGVTSLLVTEIRAADGYILSSETHTVVLKKNACVELELFNKSKPGLQIRKIDSESLLPVSDCVFNVQKITNGAKTDLGNFTSGDNGLIFIPNLEEGYLEITEIKAKEGYKLDPTPKTIFIESGKLNTVEFKNQPYSELIIKKASDSDDPKPLQGATFRVYDERRIEIGTYTTSELGEIVIKDLLEKVIYVQEISAPKGYLLDSTVRKIEIPPGKVVTIHVKNTELGSLRILKRCAVTGEPIPNTFFLIYDAKNNIVGEFQSDQHGVVTLPATIPPQKLKIKELRAASGFVLSKIDYYVDIKSGETAEIIIENEPERGRIQIVKVSDAFNDITKDKEGAVLKDAQFKIYNNKMEVVDEITTDSDGMATSKDLPLGVYGIKETQSPSYYFTDGEMFYAEIKVHEDLVKFKVKNTPVVPKVTIEKRGVVEAKAGESIYYDFSNITNSSNVALDEFYWHDKLPTDAIRLEKIWTGIWNERVKLSVQIKTNLKPGYRTIKSGLLSTVNNEIDCSQKVLGLASNEYVTDFKVVFGTVEPDFKCTTGPKIQVKILDTVPNQYNFTNKTDVGGRFEKEWVYEIDGWTVIVFNIPKGGLPRTGL